MSLHYEVVVACFLREDTPPEVLDAVRWHIGLAEERPDGLDPGEHPVPAFLLDPESRLPGGDVAELRRQYRWTAPDGADVYAWGLHARGRWLDDDLGNLAVLLDLLAPCAEDGHAGSFREEHDLLPTVLAFRDGAHFVAGRAE
ncbi:hypothetical protein [Nocardiopsis composta]|uniref:Uncharacterized protein n=1 Tax=Nocardiopsis composta TaxID=157465 RepID=A0A7W8VBU6_9ACTN|nr:hypothetical protein [Nocardiopsis composta]MBB5430270.1 hypothetical protein [Nocardiopsis composta]